MKEAFVIVNLGSPKSLTIKDIKSYLLEFLMDKFVIDLNYFLRLIIVRGIILNTRPKKSLSAYRKIWRKKGSPLIIYTENLASKIEKKTGLKIYVAMRYGAPSISSVLEKLKEENFEKINVIPLYPQYAMATTKTVEEKFKEEAKKIGGFKINFFKPFYNRMDYIKLLSSTIKKSIDPNVKRKIVFSYHGVPHRHIYKSDNCLPKRCKINNDCCSIKNGSHPYCYRHHCYETTRLVVNEIGLKDDDYLISFQSRLGFEKWLQPSTEDVLKKLPKEGEENIIIVTPAFVSDCVETLEEIEIEAKKTFQEAGGKEFIRVSCLNDSDSWATILSNWITK